MKKLFTLVVIMLSSIVMLAKEGGTLTSSASPIDPSETVTLTYDGTGTNFANWEPLCFIHSWLIPYEGKSFTKDYGTEWASCNGDADYAALPAKVKMTFISKGKYSISMNIKEFFGVAEEDLEKISDIGIVVRAQYAGDENQTKDFVLPVEVPGSTPPERPSFYITGDENLVGKDKAWNSKAIPVFGETYSIPNVEPGYYEMKITVDGTFETAKGYTDLTGSRRRLQRGGDDNIVMPVGATCDIKVTYNGISFLVEGRFGPQMNTKGQFAWYVAGNFTGNAETDWFAGKIPLTYQSGKGFVGTVHLEENKDYQFKLVRVGTWPESGIDGSITAWYTTETPQLMTFDNNIDWVVWWYDYSAEAEPVHLQSTFEGDYTFVVRPDDEWHHAYYDIIYPEDLREKRTITYYPGESKEQKPQYMVHASGGEGEIGYYTNMTPVEEGGEISYYTYELPIELTKYLHIVRATHDVPNWQYLDKGDYGNILNEVNLQFIPLNCNTSWFVDGALNGRNNLMRVFFCGPTSDGYYLSLDGFNWPLYNVDDAHKFVLKDADKHIYSLITNLSVGDKLRALEIEDLEIKNHYPLPDMDSYEVDAAHAGERTVLFCPNYQSDWSEFGGYLYIESESGTSIENHPTSGTITKILRDGQILILRGDKTYTVTGQEVK